MLEVESDKSNRIDFVYNLDSPLTKFRVFHDFARMVKGSTFSKMIFFRKEWPLQSE